MGSHRVRHDLETKQQQPHSFRTLYMKQAQTLKRGRDGRGPTGPNPGRTSGSQLGFFLPWVPDVALKRTE